MAKITVDLKLWVHCPHCDNEMDLVNDPDDGGRFTDPIFSNRWDELKGYNIYCPECGQDFYITEIEW